MTTPTSCLCPFLCAEHPREAVQGPCEDWCGFECVYPQSHELTGDGVYANGRHWCSPSCRDAGRRLGDAPAEVVHLCTEAQAGATSCGLGGDGLFAGGPKMSLSRDRVTCPACLTKMRDAVAVGRCRVGLVSGGLCQRPYGHQGEHSLDAAAAPPLVSGVDAVAAPVTYNDGEVKPMPLNPERLIKSTPVVAPPAKPDLVAVGQRWRDRGGTYSILEQRPCNHWLWRRDDGSFQAIGNGDVIIRDEYLGTVPAPADPFAMPHGTVEELAKKVEAVCAKAAATVEALAAPRTVPAPVSAPRDLTAGEESALNAAAQYKGPSVGCGAPVSAPAGTPVDDRAQVHAALDNALEAYNEQQGELTLESNERWLINGRTTRVRIEVGEPAKKQARPSKSCGAKNRAGKVYNEPVGHEYLHWYRSAPGQSTPVETPAPTDPRPVCIKCGSRWVPPEGVDATVSGCLSCEPRCFICWRAGLSVSGSPPACKACVSKMAPAVPAPGAGEGWELTFPAAQLLAGERWRRKAWAKDKWTERVGPEHSPLKVYDTRHGSRCEVQPLGLSDIAATDWEPLPSPAPRPRLGQTGEVDKTVWAWRHELKTDPTLTERELCERVVKDTLAKVVREARNGGLLSDWLDRAEAAMLGTKS